MPRTRSQLKRSPLDSHHGRGGVIHRMVLSLFIGAAVTNPLSSVEAQLGGSQRPNVVLIITDDVGYGDLGSYGAPDVKTAHIDSLARDGVRLTDFYANGATCSPTRTGRISGRYQQRFGVEQPIGFNGRMDWDRGLLPMGSSLRRLLKN